MRARTWRRIPPAARRLLAAASAVAAMALLAACGSDGDSASGGTAAVEPVTVGLASGGSRQDGSWTQAWYEGSQTAQAELGDTVKVTFVDETNSVDAYDKSAASFLSGGGDTWIFATAEVPQLVDKFAKQFPDSMVCGVEAPRESYAANICTLLPRFEQGTFLAGFLAGSMSETGHVGVVGAFDFPILTAELEGFVLGARYANPDIKISRTYIQSFSDPAKGRAAALAQMSQGADILFSGVDQATQGIYQAARTAPGTYVIPQYFDSWEQAPDVVLTSVIYNLQGVSQEMIRLAASGELANQHYEFDLKNDGVGKLAPFHELDSQVSDDIKSRLAEVEAQVISGEILVPGPDVLGTTGAGSKLDLATIKAE